MNELTKEDLICGFTVIPEIYCEYIHTPLTRTEKKKIFISKIMEIIVEALWFLFFTIGIMLQVSGLAYLAGVFFKFGAS